MEPPRKRQRLLEPASKSNPDNEELESYLDYENCDDEDDYEEFDEDEGEGFDYDEPEMPLYGAGEGGGDLELAERRARVDQKLKSKWEILFEKYSKDFTGIGDEIDLATGEIVVDNGHLKSMQDEKDIGRSRRGRSLLRALTVEPEGLSTLVPLPKVRDECYSGSTSQDEDEEDMEENTIRNTTEIQQEDVSSASRDAHAQQEDVLNSIETSKSLTGPSGEEKILPSREEILERFGDLGPKVIQLLDQQKGGLNQDNIEPAWRAPELPSKASGKRPLLQSILLRESDDERSPSPDRGTSLWAVPSGLRQRQSSEDSSGFESQSLGRREEHAYFTPLDDEILLKEMTKAKERGMRIDGGEIYADMASAYPHHSKREWYSRWYRTRRVPGVQQAMSLGATPDEIKEWKFDGLEWIPKTPAYSATSSDLHTSRTVEYVKRVIRTEQPGTGDYRKTDVHTFVGVMISETEQQRCRALIPASSRFEEISSHQLEDDVDSSFQHDHIDSPIREPSTLDLGQLQPTSIPAKRPHWQVPWNEADIPGSATITQQARVRTSTKGKNGRQRLGDLSSKISSKLGTNAIRTASDDLLNKLKSFYAKPLRSKSLSLLQLAPGDQHVAVSEGGHEYYVRLTPCPHRDCRKSSALYKAARTNKDGMKCEFTMHLKDEHDFSMYPCLEQGCKRKGKLGFQNPGKLINHVKASHDYRKAWIRLQKIIDRKTFTSNGINIDEQIINLASTEDAVDELQDESSGLGIQLKTADNRNVPQHPLLEDSADKPIPRDVQVDEYVQPVTSTSSSKQVLEDNMLTMILSEPPNSNDDTSVTADQESSAQIALLGKPRSSDIDGKVKSHDISPVLTSPPKTTALLSSSGSEDNALVIGNRTSSPIIIDSSSVRRYPLRSSTTDLTKLPKFNNTSTDPLSTSPEIPNSTTPSSSHCAPVTPQSNSSPKKSSIYAPRRSLPMNIADSDETDELSILAPTPTPSLMSCRSISISRTPSRVSSPFNDRSPSRPSSAIQKKRSAGRLRHSLPMSAIPPRTVPKTSRKSLSGYDYKASSLRHMLMPSTPTKNRKRNAGGGTGDDDVELFKTPGGTLRRCGREGFFCGREFCFRCVIRDGK